MGIIEIILLGIGLSMDAFAVSVCKGLSVSKLQIKHALTVGIYFGGFQALMPLIGYLLGTRFQSLIASVDHWIAFALLVLIGANMVREAIGEEGEEKNDSFSFCTMLLLAVATSIDALAVGVSFGTMGDKMTISIVLAVCIIGLTTFIISLGGVFIGNGFGIRYKKRSEIAGGIILIMIGLKIVLEHYNILF